MEESFLVVLASCYEMVIVLWLARWKKNFFYGKQANHYGWKRLCLQFTIFIGNLSCKNHNTLTKQIINLKLRVYNTKFLDRSIKREWMTLKYLLCIVLCLLSNIKLSIKCARKDGKAKKMSIKLFYTL